MPDLSPYNNHMPDVGGDMGSYDLNYDEPVHP